MSGRQWKRMRKAQGLTTKSAGFTLMNRKEQVLQAAYYDVARNNSKVVNYLAQQVVDNAGKSK